MNWTQMNLDWMRIFQQQRKLGEVQQLNPDSFHPPPSLNFSIPLIWSTFYSTIPNIFLLIKKQSWDEGMNKKWNLATIWWCD